MFFTKKKQTIFYMNLKKSDNLKFKEALNRELMKHDLNNIDYENFLKIGLSILDAHASVKKKHLRANHASFVTSEFRKAAMKRARLKNVYLEKRTEATKATSNYQRNICVSLLRKSKRSYFENLNVKFVRDNKNLEKRAPFFPIKSNLKRESHLLKIKMSFQAIKKLLKPSTNSLVTLKDA